MKKDHSLHIDSILNKPASLTLAFKAEDDKDQVGQVICSFLNGKGGQLVLGIGDNQQVTGIAQAETKAHELLNYLEQEIIPEPAISVEVAPYQGQQLILVNVWKGTKQPYIFKGGIYFRAGSTTVKSSSKQLADIIHSRPESNTRWEVKSAIEVREQDIDLNEVLDCIKDASGSGRGENIASDPLQFLNKYGLYKNGDFTNAAVLLFGKNPVQYFPQVRVRLAVFKTDKAGERMIYDKHIEQNLFQTVRQVTDFFDLAYGISSSFKSNDWKRNDVPGFPRLAVREAVLNAIIHRDYSSHSSSIAIHIYPKKLVISSYGKFPKGVTIKSLSEDHLSVPVNPDIAHIFFLRRWIEKIGRGTLKMIAQCQEMGFSIPIWSKQGNSVSVTFPNISIPFNYSEGISEGISEGLMQLIQAESCEGLSEGATGGISDNLKKALLDIIELLVKNDALRASEISDKLNRPYKTIERHIKRLRALKAIVFRGSKKTGGYRLTDYWQDWRKS